MSEDLQRYQTRLEIERARNARWRQQRANNGWQLASISMQKTTCEQLETIKRKSGLTNRNDAIALAVQIAADAIKGDSE